MTETLPERMRHAAAHVEIYDQEWEAQQLREGAAEIERLQKLLQQVLVDAHAQDVLLEWWHALEVPSGV